jgi:agmatine/peptidylarginine deiminase
MLFCGFLCTAGGLADEARRPLTPEQQKWLDENPHSLPIWMTPEEEERKGEIGIDFRGTAPPAAPVRMAAEFEPVTGVLIRWPLGIPYDLIAEMSEDVEVWTIVGSTAQQTSAETAYTANGVTMANCRFFIAPTDSYWTRDYGPWFVYTGSGDQGIVDHIYNRPRPNDDAIPQEFGDYLGIPVYGMDLVATGGNWMCDGLGVGMSTRLTLDENPGMTGAQVDQILLDYCGITDYYPLPYTESGGIHHIDCTKKFLDVDTILVEEKTPSDPELEANVAFLRTLTSSWGTPYEIIRVPVGNGNTEAYTNSLILNAKVLVPVFGTSHDAVALQIYADAMPGYEIIGFDGSWLSDDAIHCRAKGIMDRYMLYIDHTPLTDPQVSGGNYLVIAEIHPYSGQPVSSGFPQLRYSNDGGTFTNVTMTSAGGDTWQGTIPAQADGTTVRYYIHAEDDSGRVENHPYIGALGAHRFTVATTGSFLVVGPGPGEANPPLVRVFPPGQDAAHVYEFSAYGAPQFGVNVSCGDVTGNGYAEILSGAGPGAIYGPHVRGFTVDGTPLPGLSFLAYGTNKYGVNVSAGDIDGDGYDEIVTGAGPGAVFGPHVRAFDYDGTPGVTPVTGVSYLAYGTPKWGVNVTCGDVDGDGFDEIVSGAGPGAVYGPHVRGWDVDGGAAVAMPGLSFLAYGTNKFGVNVSCGDLDGDGIDEIVTGAGPGAVFGAHVRGWNYDGAAVSAIAGFSFFAWDPGAARYGAKVFAGADLDDDGRAELVVGYGPDPSVSTQVKIYRYNGAQVTDWFSLEAFTDLTRGTSVAAGRF